MKTEEAILLDNPLIYAALLYTFCKKMGKCDFIYPFLVLPLITDERYSSIINTKGKKELFYLIKRVKGTGKESFYTEYNRTILRKKEIIFDALKLCVDNNFISFVNEDENTFLVVKKNMEIVDIVEWTMIKNFIKISDICSKTNVFQFISAMKVRI